MFPLAKGVPAVGLTRMLLKVRVDFALPVSAELTVNVILELVRLVKLMLTGFPLPVCVTETDGAVPPGVKSEPAGSIENYRAGSNISRVALCVLRATGQACKCPAGCVRRDGSGIRRGQAAIREGILCG
jgi:hypothetical protein